MADADARYTCDEQRAHAMEVKLNRQRIVLAGRAPGLDIVVTEGALRQTVGPPRVMREQLGRLAAMAETGYTDGQRDARRVAAAERSRVSLRVLPFAAGAHAAAGCGSMTLLRFAETPEIGVVHLAALSGGVSLEGREEVVRYLRAFAPAPRGGAHPVALGAADPRRGEVVQPLSAGRVGLDRSRAGGGHRHRTGGEREFLVDVLELGDQVLDVAQLLGVVSHAVAVSHGPELQGREGGLDGIGIRLWCLARRILP